MAVQPSVIWEITRQCNFNCEHCIVDSTKKVPPGELSTEQAKQFMKSYASIGGRVVHFSGGEPLMRKDLKELMKYGKKLNIQCYSLATNGYFLTEKRMKSLFDAGLVNVQISLDGIDSAQNLKIRKGPPDAFERAIQAIRIARKFPIQLTIGMFLHPENIDSIPRMVQLCEREKVSILRFSGFIPLGRGRNPEVIDRMRFTPEQMVRFFEFISSYKSSLTGVVIGFDHAFGPFYDYYTCSAGKSTFYLSSNGDLYPCPSFTHPDFKVGNVVSSGMEKLKTLLQSRKMKSCQAPVEKITGDCARCVDLNWCRGGCRGVAYAYREKITASFPNCLRLVQRNFSKCYPSIPEPPTPGQMRQKSRIYERKPGKNYKDPAKSALYGSAGAISRPKEAGIRKEKVVPLTPGKRIASIKPSHPPKSKTSFRYNPNPISMLDKFYENHARNSKFLIENHPLSYLLWESTLNCNFKCRHCSSPRENWNPEKEMTTEQVKTVLKKFADGFSAKKIQALGITGGEPTLRKDLPEIIAYMNKLGFLAAMDTNGYIIGNNPDLLDQYEKAGLKIICVSLDGMKDEFKKFRGVDGFDQAVHTIRHIVENHPRMQVQTITMVTQHNFNSVERIFKTIEQLGVPYARFGTVMPIGRAAGMPENFLEPDQIRQLLKWIAEKREDYRNKKTTLQIEFTDDGWCGRMDRQGFEGLVRDSCFMCTAGITMGIISYDGKFGGCLSVPPELNYQGDLLKEDPLKIWRERFQVFRDKNRLHIGVCVDCDQWDYCLGGGMHERDVNRRMKTCMYRRLQQV